MQFKSKEGSLPPILPLRYNEITNDSQCNYNLMSDGLTRSQRHWNTLRRAVLNGHYSQQRFSTRSLQTSLHEAKQSARRFTVDVIKPLGLASIVFINVGAIIYALGEGWRILDSLYFVMVTLSTIGASTVRLLHLLTALSSNSCSYSQVMETFIRRRMR